MTYRAYRCGSTPDTNAMKFWRGSTMLPSRGRTHSERARSSQPDLNVDAFFVTLSKSEADYSPTTMYRDYPISPNSSIGSHNRRPRRGRGPRDTSNGTELILIFAREQPYNEFGTTPYLFLGPAAM